jgi:hypothetical protein
MAVHPDPDVVAHSPKRRFFYAPTVKSCTKSEANRELKYPQDHMHIQRTLSAKGCILHFHLFTVMMKTLFEIKLKLRN